MASLAGITPQDLAALVADASGLALAPRGAPDPALAKLLPESMARRHGVAPVALDDGRLVVAVATPDISQALQELRFAAGGRTVEARIAAPEDIEAARVALYGATPRSAASQHGRILDLDDEGAETLSGDAQLVRFCRALVRQAIARRASDIHIHPLAGTGVVRLRIDGRLVRVASISLTVMAAVIRLLKAQGGMDSTNAMVPQDGRASLTYQRRRYDLRISTLPASGAESLVMRLLDQSRTFDLEHTNFAPWALEALRRLASNANGLVLITGPTGSGKTSTLYSLLAALNKTTRRIITVEEPLEYELDGLTQVEVNNAAGVTFQRALRSILRQDPDVLLIGEIRDAETAQIAVQAALTGHLVFSTLHTQDAVRAIPRLVDLGVAPELLADTLLGVVSQRLMRQLCPHCKTACAAPLRPIESLFEQVTGAPPGARAVGCKHCDHTGYHGRFPVVEALEIPDTMRSQLLRGNSDGDALAAAIPGHWRSIESNAANWVISGLTTPDEAFESLGLRLWTTLARKAGVDAPIAALLGSSESVGTQGASQATALIISTNVPMAGVLCARLEQLGQVPLVVDSPLAASQALQSEHHLQLLVVDITEPDPQRRAYAQELRASLAWSGLRTLVIYDGAEAGIVERMEAFGMRSFLPAPLDEAAFEQRVAQLISEG
ncbi:GspE/PulE family protein [uncultured Ramlibacter sp.]|uniref:GspE/PulE family protein n=1 Tax=uncultured Ramlibacter sp. TaxID=260755 RepID=UPI00261FBEB3|nr:GspE/PulE family protein [uncultured Ramlibacter sp.]